MSDDGLMDDVLRPIQKEGQLCIELDLWTQTNDDDREYWKLAFLICLVLKFIWDLVGLSHQFYMLNDNEEMDRKYEKLPEEIKTLVPR